MDLSVSIAVSTDAGSRDVNEDSHLTLYGEKAPCGTEGLFAVADGMGGRGSGAAASSMTLRTIADVFPAACQVNEPKRVVDVRDLLRFALQKANASIYRAASMDRSLRGSGATCLAASIAEGVLYLAHVGDSRAYLLRAGKLRRLTEDEWTREGPATVVNQAVGLQPVLFPVASEMALLPDDVLVLSTDGLTEAVPDARIEELLQQNSNPRTACTRLLREALSAPKPDNVTIIVVRLESEE